METTGSATVHVSEVSLVMHHAKARFFRSLQLAIARMLRRRHAAFLRPSLPDKNTRLLAIVAVFVFMHVFAAAMLVNAAVSVVKSAQSEVMPSLVPNQNDDLRDQVTIRNGDGQ